jgi:hypothetical protein
MHPALLSITMFLHSFSPEDTRTDTKLTIAAIPVTFPRLTARYCNEVNQAQLHIELELSLLLFINSRIKNI